MLDVKVVVSQRLPDTDEQRQSGWNNQRVPGNQETTVLQVKAVSLAPIASGRAILKKGVSVCIMN